MANTDSARGFKVLESNGTMIQKCKVDSTDATRPGIGDIVKLDGVVSGSADGMYPIVTAITASTDLPYGVIVGKDFNVSDLGELLGAASTDRYVFVDTDPQALLEGQFDTDSTLIAGDIGLNFDVLCGSGYTANTTTGWSTQEVDESSGATQDDLDDGALLRCIGLVNRPDNTLAQHAKGLFRFNVHALKSDVGSNGI